MTDDEIYSKWAVSPLITDPSVTIAPIFLSLSMTCFTVPGISNAPETLIILTLSVLTSLTNI